MMMMININIIIITVCVSHLASRIYVSRLASRIGYLASRIGCLVLGVGSGCLGVGACILQLREATRDTDTVRPARQASAIPIRCRVLQYCNIAISAGGDATTSGLTTGEVLAIGIAALMICRLKIGMQAKTHAQIEMADRVPTQKYYRRADAGCGNGMALQYPGPRASPSTESGDGDAFQAVSGFMLQALIKPAAVGVAVTTQDGKQYTLRSGSERDSLRFPPVTLQAAGVDDATTRDARYGHRCRDCPFAPPSRLRYSIYAYGHTHIANPTSQLHRITFHEFPCRKTAVPVTGSYEAIELPRHRARAPEDRAYDNKYKCKCKCKLYRYASPGLHTYVEAREMRGMTGRPTRTVDGKLSGAGLASARPARARTRTCARYAVRRDRERLLRLHDA
ncbi:hypothetical protein EVG20_g2699 [Dentipellis fragilis]|uniref:Uncharacterized protein n=1 Tax=Dentipellis fragilis TaxID=205917 RepID=A0A4Y9Z8D4_9AGAM|nr:hypothetical protein EVG20_g2699 [Dentipellis fragilis]